MARSLRSGDSRAADISLGLGLRRPDDRALCQLPARPARDPRLFAGRWRGIGHNPLGALSVVALLVTLLIMALTGLFANDDILFDGPLYGLVDKELSDQLTSIHKWFEPVILALVGLHLAAIVFYGWVKKQPLVRAMLTGWREDEAGEADKMSEAAPSTGGGPLAFLFAVAVAVAVVVAANGVWL